MISVKHRYFIIDFDPRSPAHLFQFACATFVLFILACEWVAPGWLPTQSWAPPVDLHDPARWLGQLFR